MSAESPEAALAEEQKEMEDKVISPEKAEEAKLKARYPHLRQKPGGSDFLRQWLKKGQKYFDSGDHSMAKAKMKNKQLPSAAPDKTKVTVLLYPSASITTVDKYSGRGVGVGCKSEKENVNLFSFVKELVEREA